MLVHLRRSLISIVVITVFFGFVYAFAGTGVAQLLFKHQADGSITRQRLDPHRPELVADEVPRSPARELRLPRPARRPRALRRLG